MRIWNRTLVALSFILMLALMSACGNSSPQSSPGDASATPVPSPSSKGPKQWKNPPAMSIDPNKTYEAEVKTSKGTFTMQLLAKEAPKTVNNFVFLAKEGYYDNVIFHRIIKSFMAQTGDPTGDGTGGPGYTFEDELKPGVNYEPGTVAMANRGKNTNGSQFFICTGPDCAANLNSQPNYTIFGKVTAGMDTIQKIAETPVKQGRESLPSVPTEKVTIDSIAIKEK